MKEGGMDAIDHRTHVNEVHGDVAPRPRQERFWGGTGVEVWVPATGASHDWVPFRLAGAERGKQLPTRGVVETGEVDRAVALIAQDFDERRPSLFRWRLKLAVHNAQQVHLQGLYLKILCVSAVRTRERQCDLLRWTVESVRA